MATNSFIRPSDDDLDVPDFMKPVSLAKPNKTIVGKVVDHIPPAEENNDEDDIAPGMVEYYRVRPPVLPRAGSAAMVVASHTGRVVGLSARAGAAGSKWFGHGLWHSAHLGWRYVRAHDHQEVIGGMSSSAHWNKVHETRRKRWRLLGWLGGTIAGVDLVAWDVLARSWHMSSLDAFAVAPGIEAAAAVAWFTMYGRYRINAKLAPGQMVDPDDVDDADEPYPLAWCTSGEQVEECISRALAYEGIATRRIDLLGRRGWGWEVDIDLKGSTPGKVNTVADQLDAHFNIKTGGTLIEPDPQKSAHIVLRLVTDDPFANMAKAQVHAPNSLDISDPHNFFSSMDGARPGIVLEGTRVLVIGVSGSAKSTGVLRDLAEVITACHNAIALDLDPVKDGLREYEGVMAVPPIRGNEDCEEWLGYLVKMAEARNKVRNRLDMGDTWVATREHPAIFPIVDEFIYLSKDAKELFIMLLRLGRQTGIYPIAAGQDATANSLGDAIADSFTLRIALACRHADIPIVLGSGAIAAGWRPDRLQPAQNAAIRNDAGRSYIRGAGLDRPILYGWNELTRDQIKHAVQERKTVGRPWFDHDTLAAANLLHLATEYGPGTSGRTLPVADRLEAIGGNDARTVALLLRLFDQETTTFLPTASIVDAGIATDGAELQALLARLVPLAKSTKEYVGGKQQRGWERKVADEAAAALFAPSSRAA